MQHNVKPHPYCGYRKVSKRVWHGYRLEGSRNLAQLLRRAGWGGFLCSSLSARHASLCRLPSSSLQAHDIRKFVTTGGNCMETPITVDDSNGRLGYRSAQGCCV